MIGNKYLYAICDCSLVLSRAAFAVSAGKKPGEYTSADVIRLTIQTLRKLSRDWGVTHDKCLMIFDKWKSEYGGYYRTYLLKGAYKDDRGDIEGEKGKANPLDTYMTREKYEALKQDPDISQEDLEKAYEKLYFNEVKYDSKWTMIRELKKFGVPFLGVAGMEYDDVAYIASNMLYDASPGAKPSIFVTKDSDLLSCTTPMMDYFKIPTKGSEPKILTYREIYEQTMPPALRGKISLYAYRSFVEALGDGHNGMRRTRKDRVDQVETILKIMDGDYSNLSDPELFKLQFSSFDVTKFPEFEETKRLITDLFGTAGKLGSLAEFHEFCDKYKITGISDKYFTDFISTFDSKLYCER